MRKSRSETLVDYSKHFRALVQQEHSLTRLHEASPMCEEASVACTSVGFRTIGRTSTTPAAKYSRPRWLQYHSLSALKRVKDASIVTNLTIAGVTNPTAGTSASEATTEAMVINNRVVEVVDVVVLAAEAAVVVATAAAIAPTAPTTTSTAPFIARVRTTRKPVEYFTTTINRRSASNAAFMRSLKQQQGQQFGEPRVSFQLINGDTRSDGAMLVRFRIPQLKRDAVNVRQFEVLPSLPDELTIGRDLVTALSVMIAFQNCRVQWDGSELSVRTTSSTEEPLSRPRPGLAEVNDEIDEALAGDSTDVTPVDLLPQHLDVALSHCYLKLLEEYVDLYNGRLGRIHLDDYIFPLRPDYVPSHARPYSIARSLEDGARREIQRLIKLDVIEQIYGSGSAAAPAFFLRKASGSLRVLVDFRRLNKLLSRSPYFVSKIREILLRLSKAKYMSNLDENMGYFARQLAPQS
ncbi:unnamed protein product [Phytophthora fragariaefolia]|uniref:Unnamed protein product n=1 Tax=Phytophthora fragariaefolia TaxID=1490495 RepID=A0A9W7D7A5_9STRA|nr:unnamed protein product [Phytophthora fragariaefolia]